MTPWGQETHVKWPSGWPQIDPWSTPTRPLINPKSTPTQPLFDPESICSSWSAIINDHRKSSITIALIYAISTQVIYLYAYRYRNDCLAHNHENDMNYDIIIISLFPFDIIDFQAISLVFVGHHWFASVSFYCTNIYRHLWGPMGPMGPMGPVGHIVENKSV